MVGFIILLITLHAFTHLPGDVFVEIINKWCQQAKLVSTSSDTVSILARKYLLINAKQDIC